MLSESVLQKLKSSIRGPLLSPGEDGYDAARTLPNAMIDRKPGAIARCAGVADVLACVRIAREHDLLVAVRGGGHSLPGKSVCDGGLTIDMSLMKGIRVDPVRRTVRAQTGVKLGEFEFAPWIGILVATAALDKKRHRARMGELEGLLRVPGVVAAPLVKAERGIMTSVAKEDGSELTVGPRHAEHWHDVVEHWMPGD